jgi:hypothetical protein
MNHEDWKTLARPDPEDLATKATSLPEVFVIFVAFVAL